MCRSYRHTIAQTRPNAAHSEPELADLDGRSASRSQVPLGALLRGGSPLTPEAADALIIRARSAFRPGPGNRSGWSDANQSSDDA